MWTYNYQTSNEELYHHGVLGMKWGHRKARLDSARQKMHDPRNTTKAERKIAKQEFKSAKKAYKSGTALNRHQKNVRLGSTIAATLLLSPIGGITVAALTTSHYRGLNDELRKEDK